MQNKGALKLLVVALVLASAYALSFTWVARNVEKKADAYAATATPERREEMRQNYLDSMGSQTVYNLGFIKFNYRQVKEKELNLGLDLKGGMNVMLEISPRDVVRALSNNNQSPAFNEALSAASAVGGDYVDNFARAYAQIAPGSQLSDIFATPDAIQAKTLALNATDQQVVTYLHSQVNSAIDASFEILSRRIDKFGITQPNIQRVKNSGRILVELPGIKEPERVRKLLQGSASLEFWMTYDNAYLYPVLEQVDSELRRLESLTAAPVENEGAEVSAAIEEVASQQGDAPLVADLAAETAADSSLLSQITGEDGEEILSNEALRQEYPLFSRLTPSIGQDGMPMPGAIVGYAQSYDTAVVNSYFNRPEIKGLLPQDLKLMWGVKAMSGDPAESTFELYAIRDRSGKGTPELDGSAVDNARGDYERTGVGTSSRGEVTMQMNREGGIVWENLTRDAIDESNHRAGFSSCIAIVLDNYVYSAPGVRNVISGGNSSITGNFTILEAQDLANVLKSGKLPAPARIVQEAVVGPSLGAESISASMISFIVAFILVLIYMIVFYSGAGTAASIALVANLVFLFGVLVSFGAVLTLPGIAGIVLTMGMAVDANVIIYERIKEELRAGKGLSAAIAAGYRNAMSAIIDANVTTLLTAIILAWFGTGPVQGFATTLIIGIITSLFTSIFITRLIFDARLKRGSNIAFSNKLTRNFLSNTKINFLGIRKVTYAISIILVLVSIASFFTMGLNRGVDFTGGRAYVIRFDHNVTDEQVRTSLQDAFDTAEGDAANKSFEVKQFGNENQFQKRIVTQYLAGDDSDDATAKVETVLYQGLNPLYDQSLTQEEFATTSTNINGILSINTVEASVASGIVIDSFIAVILGLIGIGVYIILRFRKWQWGMGSIIALAHDAFLTVGIFSLLHMVLPFNLEIDQTFIAAILTIIGYSINDKVVIFDRIREYNTLYPKRSARENINNALNSTLSRTVNTSGTTLVVLLAIFLFGGEVIRGFVFALMFGILIGTYSSVFTATPLAYDLLKKGERDKGK